MILQHELPWMLTAARLLCALSPTTGRFAGGEGGDGLRAALDALCRQATEAVEGGASILILSDRGIDPELAPIPALLAIGAGDEFIVLVNL